MFTMSPVIIILILVGQGLVCGVFAMVLADEKGYSPGGWFVCGLLFSIIALIAAAGLPIKPSKEPGDNQS